MSNEARPIDVKGASLTITPFNDDENTWSSETIALCGVDTIAYSDGSTDDKDVTDFCAAAKGQREKIAGLKEPGSLSLNIIKFDPKQVGQKWLNDAPVNKRFKLTVQIAVGEEHETLTLELKKKTSPSFNVQVGEVMNGSVECIVDANPQWS